jgi:ubiquitin carboxyl-terminal hydrolase 1
MSDYGSPAGGDAYGPWTAPESITVTILLATVVGAYLLSMGPELLGYPGMQRARAMLSGLDSLLRRGARITGVLSRRTNAPPGLGNYSNSCYQNSVIQGLAALPALRDYLTHITTAHPSFTTDTTNGALHELISMLNDPNNQGRNFWIPGQLKAMSILTQQDAQEYYAKIMDELDTEVKKASSSKRRSSESLLEATRGFDEPATSQASEAIQEAISVTEDAVPVPPDDVSSTAADDAEPSNAVSNPLDGLIAQRVGCTSCGYSEGLSLISFNCITVSLGSDYAYDIRDCLDEYTKLEYIDGVECAKCTLLKLQKTLTPLAEANPASPFAERLNAVLEMLDDEKFEDNTLVKTLNIPKKNWVQGSKSKQIVVARAPKSLVLHVNRSIFDETTGAQYKNTAGVSYPSTLDLGDWCLGNAPSRSKQPDISLEEWPRDPKQSMLANQQQRTHTSPFRYRLRAAVTHAGTHGYGHYVCYRPHARVVTQPEDGQEPADAPQREQWWRFSDDNVIAIPEEQAHQGNVFMLFYERLDEPATPQPSEAIQEAVSAAEDAPLPPAVLGDFDDEAVAAAAVAAAVPLPDDDERHDIVALQPPLSPGATSGNPLAEADRQILREDVQASLSPGASPPPPPAPPAEHDIEADMPTSDSEAELAPPTPRPFVPIPLHHVMRTSGNPAARGQGSRQSLPMVSPT